MRRDAGGRIEAFVGGGIVSLICIFINQSSVRERTLHRGTGEKWPASVDAVDDAHPDMFHGVTMLPLRRTHEHGPADIRSLAEFLRKRGVTVNTHSARAKQGGGETDTKLGGYDVAPREWVDALGFGCLLHLETMLVRACEEHHWTSGVQDALKSRDDVRGDERVEVADVWALRGPR